MGRAIAARWAGTSGPGVGPSPLPRPEPPIIPAEWKGDQQTLRDALENDCLALLKSDPDDEVRYQALLAVVNLELLAQRDALTARIVGLFVDLYRHDPSAQIRAEVVKTFRLMPNSTPEMRAVLRDAVVDANASVRYEGLTGIASRRLSFDEARDTIVTALKHADPRIRLAAVQALNEFGASAASYIETLERLSGNDPDAQVRASARLAIEAIQRALRSRGKP
jgi:HEAT repeat protein